MDRLSIYAKKNMKKINKLNFKKTLGKFATGVTVICTNDDNQIYGITVNSFSSLSLSPPLVLFSLGKNSSSINSFLKSKIVDELIIYTSQKNLGKDSVPWFKEDNAIENYGFKLESSCKIENDLKQIFIRHE